MPSDYDRDTVVEELKTYNPRATNSWKALKYRAHSDDFKYILWPQRYKADWFLSERQDFIDRGLADVYSQEYLNIPIDESVAYFRKSDFVAEHSEDKKAKLNYYITADLAISQKETADYSVFLIAGVDENRVIHVRNVIRERLDGKEIVDTLLNLQKVYNPELVGIEEMQVSKAIGPFLREEMIKTGNYINLIPLKHGGKDKIARAKSVQARVRARAVKFDKSGDWYSIFEDELCKFPRGTKDDQVDAFAYLGLMLDSLIEAPTRAEEEEEQYYDDLSRANLGNDGKSALCGY
jgi:predicted phage terminase large subunit-like protein